MEISVEFTKSSVISVDLKNSVKFSSLLTVVWYWYFPMISMIFHGSLHVITNKSPKILIFGFKFWLSNQKCPKFHGLTVVSKINKLSSFDTNICMCIQNPKSPFSDQIWFEFPYPISRSFYCDPKMGIFGWNLLEFYWIWHFYFTVTDILILMKHSLIFV